MKRTGKILVALLAVIILMMSMSVITASAVKTTKDTTIYLTPNANWKQSNARFALYTWDGGDKWFDMKDPDGDGVYECTIPAGIENIIFCRMNPNATANNWNNKWNQTSDLKYNGTSNHYTVKEGTWSKGGGTWSTFASACAHANVGPAATCTTPQECLDCGDPVVSALGHTYNSSHLCTRCNEQATFTVAGSQTLCGTDWNTSDTANDMTYADGVYTKVYENVAAGTYKFKVARDHDWGTAYPASDKSFTVAKAGSTVTITLKGTAVTVDVKAPLCLHDSLQNNPEACTSAQKCSDCNESFVLGHNEDANHICTRCGNQPIFTVAGSGAHLGTEWAPANTANDMTYADGVYTKVYQNVKAGTYSLKVARDHDWGIAYPESDKEYTVAVDGSTVTVTLKGTTVDIKVESTTAVYTVAGSSIELLGASWDPANAANDMQLDETTGLWTISYTNNTSAAINLEYKVVKNRSWDLCWGGAAAGLSGSDNAYINVPAGATLTITFDATNTKITTSVVEGEVEPDDPEHEHTYVEGKCECGEIDPNYVEGYYLVGWINGVDYGCNEDWENLGNYRFDDNGKLTVTFNQDSYVFVKSVNLKGEFGWFLSETYQEDKDATLIRDKSEKLKLPGNTEITLTLTVNEDGTLTLVADYHTHSHTKVVTDPTCTEAGYTTYTCECGDTYTADDVAALGHDMVVDTAVAPTCESTGLTEGSHCTRCDHKIAQEEVAALGHNAGEAVVENKVAPNCTEDGSHDEVVYCTVCGDELSRNTVTDAKLNHKASDEWVKENEVAPTCENKGSYDLVLRCSVCGEELDSEKVDVDALGHKAGDPVVENSTAASCGAAGSYDEVVYCTVCDKELSRTTHTVDATPHSYKATITANPSCTEAGVKTFTCSVCGDSYTEAIDALGHELTTHEAKAPTCTSIGWDAYETCSRCDHTTYNELPKLKHSYEAVVTDPTCTATGYTTNTCSACGATYISGETSALGHDMVVDAAVAPTCESTGLTEGSHCTRCDHGVAQEEVAALGHDMVVDAAVAPTCESTGLTEGSHCTRCDHKVEQEEAAALGHDMVVDAAVAPTCTTAGLTEGSHCTRCDNKVAQEEVAALGHEFDTYKSICSVCYAPNPDYIVNTIDVTKENKLICNKYHLVGDLGPYEFITFEIENAGHYKFVGAGLAFTIYTIPTEAPGADFTAGTGASWAQYVFTEADLEPGTYWIGLVYFFGEGEYTVTVEYTAPHSHSFVDGKCECGAEDPNYVPPHEHDFVDGKCECGEEDPNYVPPHEHNFVNGECECGEKDPNYVAPGEDKPGENPGDNVPELTLIQKILKAITDFFKNIKDFFARIFKK